MKSIAPVEFCWQCHGYRVGLSVPRECEDAARCTKAMADTCAIDPEPRAMFDYSELHAEQRAIMFTIMGAVAAVLLLAFAFS
jgi:hypothetical protein